MQVRPELITFFKLPFQSITPACTSAIPLFLVLMSLILKYNTGYLGEYMMMSLTVCPMFNSLGTLVFIHPYRNWILRTLGLKRWKIYSSSVEVAVSGGAQNRSAGRS
jgi:hypothetical protein